MLLLLDRPIWILFEDMLVSANSFLRCENPSQDFMRMPRHYVRDMGFSPHDDQRTRECTGHTLKETDKEHHCEMLF